MENVIYNFKKLEVTGSTKEEALAKAPFIITRDVTPTFKKWKQSQVNGISDSDIKEWCVKKLGEVTKNAPGLGLSITLDYASADTNKRPYKYTNIKNEHGKRKFKTFYQWVDKETGAVVMSTDTTKADAAAKMKKAIADHQFKGKYFMRTIKEVVEGDTILAEIEYSPSKNFTPGRYIVFGIENA